MTGKATSPCAGSAREGQPNAGTERQPPGEAVACNKNSQENKNADTGKRGGCSLQ
jgi:hypothetical protein